MSKEILELLKEQKEAFGEFKAEYDERVLNLEKKSGREGLDFLVDKKETKGFDDYLRKGDTSLMEKSMSVGTDADGGYAVPSQLDANLGNYMYDANVMRQIAGVKKVYTSDYSKAVNTGGLGAGWVGETTARTETDTPTIAKVTPPTGELYANPAATQWMLDDAGFNLESWLMSEIQFKFISMEGDAFINGNGTNKPKGILQYSTSTDDDDTRTFGVLKYVETAAATAFTTDELIDFANDLRGVYRKGAVWVMNSNTASHIRKLKDGNGLYIWQNNIQLGAPNMLLGSAVYLDESMPDIAAEANPIAYGNFKLGYEIVDRTPLRVLRDNLTNKPYTHFYSTKRVSGMVVDSNAIRLLQMAAA